MAEEQAQVAAAAPLAEQTTMVLSKTLYDSEIQWGRLVIPGRFVKHFRKMQEELNIKGDYNLWVSDATCSTTHKIGVKMSIQRPMVTELHPLYKGHKVGPGDMVAISRSHSTGALTVSVTKCQQQQQLEAARRRVVYDIAVDASRSFAGAAEQPFGSNSGPKRPRRSRQSSSRGRACVDDEEEEEEEEESEGEEPREEKLRDSVQADDSHLHAYRTGSGRLTVIPARYGSGQASTKEDSLGSRSLGGRQHSAAIDSHQPLGYSEDMEVSCGSEEEEAEEDMRRFDALVNVAAHHLTAACG